VAAEPPTLAPADVQRFIAVKGAIDNLTRVLQLVSTADGTVEQLLAADPESKAAARLAAGASLGWNNVVVGLNAFTAEQAQEIDGLVETVGTTRAAAIAWQNALQRHNGRTLAAGDLAGPQKRESQAKEALKQTAWTLAQAACDLERAHPQLAASGAAESNCSAAAKLSD
jgi:hypothetical protein